jgi:hypothetical protein
MSLYSKTVDNIVYEVDCQTITIKPGADVDIGLSFLSIIIFSQPDPTFTFLSRCQPVCRRAGGVHGRWCPDGQQCRTFVSPTVNFV